MLSSRFTTSNSHEESFHLLRCSHQCCVKTIPDRFIMCGCLNLTVNITNNGWNFSSWMKTINITNSLDRPLKKLIVMSTHFQTQIYYLPPANMAGLVIIFNVLTKSTDRAETTVKKERWSNASKSSRLCRPNT